MVTMTSSMHATLHSVAPMHAAPMGTFAMSHHSHSMVGGTLPGEVMGIPMPITCGESQDREYQHKSKDPSPNWNKS